MRPAIRQTLRPFVCQSCRHNARSAARSYSSSASPELYDVVCVGGGPAGLSLLTALRSQKSTAPLKIALVEAQSLSKASSWSLPPDQFSNRASSLTPTSRAFLEKIGAWQHLDQSRVQPYAQMQVWDGVSDARIEFDLQSHIGAENQIVAYMTENSNLVRGLLRRMAELEGIDMLDGTSVSDITLGPPTPPAASGNGPDLASWPHVALSSGRTIAARLLIGADGPNSPVRRFAAIPSDGWDYERHGVVAALTLAAHSHRRPPTAYQRFLATGPAALLPLPGDKATLVWSTTPAHAAHLRSLAPEDFVAMVNAAFRLLPADLAYLHTLPSGQAAELAWRLERTAQPDPALLPLPAAAVQAGSVAAFPLKLRHAATYTRSRVALAGDAAHSLHPLAGQGLNLGVADAASLARVLGAVAARGGDVGDQVGLEAYTADRYAANNAMLGVCDKLHKLYSVGSGPLVGLRSLGLRAVNGLAPVKELLMRQASGQGFF